MPIPPTGCLLRTDIALAVATPVPTSGAATLSVNLAPGLRGAVHGQLITASGGAGPTRWNTSERVRATLP